MLLLDHSLLVSLMYCTRSAPFFIFQHLCMPPFHFQMWFAKRRQQWKKQHKEGLAVDSTRLCTLQANPQTPFPRPFQNVIICVATATAQSSSDVPDSLPDYLPRGREFLNPSADNKFLLFTPERVTCKAKRITFPRLE